MNRLKTITVFILIICMLSANVFAINDEYKDGDNIEKLFFTAQNTPTDIFEHRFFYEINQLIGLKIFECYNDNTFMPEDVITRVEAAALLTRLMGMGININDGSNTISKFKDVEDNYWGVKYINAANSIGLMQGFEDGTFKAEENTDYDQFIKMLVKALGYESFALNKGGYPKGYVMIAAEKGILKGLEYKPGQELKRGDAAKLICNSLEVPIFKPIQTGDRIKFVEDKNINILTEYLKIFYDEGIVVANQYAGIGGREKTSDGMVKIDNFVFTDNSKVTSQMLGFEVKYYYKEDHLGNDTLVFAMPTARNEVVKVEAENITSYNNNTYTYYSQGSTHKNTINIDSLETDMFYNGRMLEKISDEYTMPPNGDILFLDNDNDGVIEVAFIHSYNSYVVNSINLDDGTIYFKDSSNKTKIILDENDRNVKFIIKDSNGTEISLKDLKKDDIISVYASQDEKYFEVIRSTKIISGTIEEIITSDGDELIRLDGKQYSIAKEFSIDNWKIGEKATFYLNHNDEIVYNSDFEASDVNYGYYIKFALSKSRLSSYYSFRILQSDGMIKTFDTEQKIYINGIKRDCSKSDDKTKIENVFGTDGLIGYKLNSNDKITNIYTIYRGEKDFGNDIKLCPSYESDTKLKYRNTGIHSFGGEIIAPDTAKVFMIPNDLSDEQGMGAPGTKALVHDTMYQFKAYKTQADSDFSDIILLSESSGSSSIDYTATLAVIDKITKVIDNNGEEALKVYFGYDKQLTSFFITDEKVLKDLDIGSGDVVLFAKKNKYSLSEIKVVYDFSEDTIVKGNLGQSDNFDNNFRIAAGKVVKMFDNVVMIENINRSSAIGKKEYIFVKYAKTYLYDGSKQTDKVSIANASYIRSEEDYGDDASFVLIRTSYSSSYEMVIINK